MNIRVGDRVILKDDFKTMNSLYKSDCFEQIKRYDNMYMCPNFKYYSIDIKEYPKFGYIEHMSINGKHITISITSISDGEKYYSPLFIRISETYIDIDYKHRRLCAINKLLDI